MPIFRKDRLHREINKKRRGKLDIIAEIMKLSHKPIRKTKIMYDARLSFSQLKKYLRYLKDCDLIMIENDGRNGVRYRRTEKGVDFLQRYSQILQMIGSED